MPRGGIFVVGCDSQRQPYWAARPRLAAFVAAVIVVDLRVEAANQASNSGNTRRRSRVLPLLNKAYDVFEIVRWWLGFSGVRGRCRWT